MNLNLPDIRWVVPILAFLMLLESTPAASLRTVEKQIPSYSRGIRTYTCLAIDGGVVPLCLPDGATLVNDPELRIEWPKDRAFAEIRKATAAEADLLDKMDQAEAPKEWKDYLAEQIKKASDQYAVQDFQPGILPVNHWQIGAMSMDYAYSGVRSCILLLLWRTQDGTTIAITMRSGYSDFKVHREAIYQMIGGSLLIPEKQPDATAQR